MIISDVVVAVVVVVSVVVIVVVFVFVAVATKAWFKVDGCQNKDQTIF